MITTSVTTSDSAIKDRITCYVLDTGSGLPAKGLRVKLWLADGPKTEQRHHHGHGQSAQVFESQTDEDGYINTWLPYSGSNARGEISAYTLEGVLSAVEGTSKWGLRFDTSLYFGKNETFFPEIYVVFKVEQGQNHHVPLLLSPYSYATYRGT